MDKIARIDMGAAGGPKVTVSGGRRVCRAGRQGDDLSGGRRRSSSTRPPAGRGKQTGHRPRHAERHHRLHDRPALGRLQEPADRHHQGVQCRRPGCPGLARLGYAAVILEGKPKTDDLYKIYINKDGIQVIVDNSLQAAGQLPAVAKLRGEYGDKVAYMTIGSAGERKLLAASIACTDPELRPTRHCGRGGVGAVMGAKRVKAIILDDAGMKMRPPKDPDKYRDANRKFVEGLRKHPVTGEGLPAYGTNVLTNVLNEAGGYPTHNFKAGVYEGGSKLSGEAQAELEIKRGGSATHGCHRGCVIQCSGIYNDKDGNYVTKQPEYETVWSHGGHCGIDDLDTVARLDYMDDNIGVDTIEMGVTIGVAMDAGLIEFGDKAGAIRLLEEVGKGTPLGRVLGSGAAITGKVFGVERVPVVKDQALPAYDPRAIQGIGVTYATTTQGADHTAGYAIATNILKVGGDVDPLKTEGQVELSRNLQIATAAIDSTGMCLFIAFAIMDQPETFQALLDMLGSFYGITMTGDDVVALGKKVLSAERDFNTRAGFTAAPRPAAPLLLQRADSAAQPGIPDYRCRTGYGVQLVRQNKVKG